MMKSVINKYVNGECNWDELIKAISYFSNPDKHPEIRFVLYDIWDDEDKKSAGLVPEDREMLLNQIHHHISLNEGGKIFFPKKFFSNVLKFAAVLVIGLVTGILISILQKPETVYYTSIAPKGSVSQMVLPDSTLVFLNSGSSLKYSINGKKKFREVFLSGEAWFDVAKNKKKPFLVHTTYYNVIVTGTQFNVKAYPGDNEIVTTLEEGSVKVVSSDKFKMDSRILKPGEQLLYDREENFLKINTVRTRMFTSWKDNKLIFINMSLKELIVLLERKYGVDIEVDWNVILDYHYDGTIHNETILDVLDILKETLPVDYNIEGQKIIIKRK